MNRLKRSLAILATAVLLAPPMAVGADEERHAGCPDSLETSQSAAAPDGWEAGRSNQKVVFDNINLSDGHPRDMAFLAPDKTVSRGEFFTNSWTVEGMGERGLWLSCTYHHSDVVLIKRLPAGVKTCEATYFQPDERALAGLTKFSCRP
ncbi:MAG: hypothetical protein JWR84_3506 [Caulobacter sp.]|nr:hypothetical protein [Caulobacter sp.]